jgi:hypothetical protein
LIRARLYQPEIADRMVRRVLQMTPDEVCDAFERHTIERPTTTMGGVIGMFCMSARYNENLKLYDLPIVFLFEITSYD